MLYLFSIQELTVQYKKYYPKKSEKYFNFGFFYHKDPITLHKCPTVHYYKTRH